jgi:hypothetical protein
MMSTHVFTEAEQTLVDAVSTESLMASTQAIAQWVRLSGTEDEARAFDWIEKQLKTDGLDTRRYLHPALVSWPEAASLRLVASDGSALDIPCATHAFAASTGDDGLEGVLVYGGRGSQAELTKADVRGTIVLVDGIVAPNFNLAVEQAGAAGSIWIAGSRLHERALSPVWGTPTPETAHLLPKTPSVSVVASEGARIKEALARGPVRVRLQTQVYQGWRQLPCLTGDLHPGHAAAADQFVMFSGHVDSWYHGAMDNGTANATMLEVSRLLAQHRDDLRRGLRVAFWSGHSHARYAGSTWYADTFWHDLHDHCVAHVNVDSVGGKDATILSEGNSMSQLRACASDVIEQVSGQRLSPRRYGRSGDQSFWGHGIPAMLLSLSEQPPENADPILLALHHQISGGASAGGGLGWWWHTPEDTVDKIDPAFLRRDATIYTLILHRLCSAPILPLDYAPVVRDINNVVADIQAKAGEHFDFTPVTEALARLDDAVTRLRAAIASQETRSTADARRDGAINRGLQRIGHALIPIDYTASGQFGHDGAVPTRPLPSLQAATTLDAMDPESDAYHFLQTRLVRERNRVVLGLRDATAVIDATLAALEGMQP